MICIILRKGNIIGCVQINQGINMAKKKIRVESSELDIVHLRSFKMFNFIRMLLMSNFLP